MIHILHLPDLHFVKNAASHNFQEVLQNEASEKVRNVPQGKKLLIVTGDFHNLEDADYTDAEQFLQKLASIMGLDIKQDVFVVPGDHDVGNDAALEPLLTPEDMNWKYHQASCLELLKTGNKSYVKERIKERLQVFRPYSNLMRQICIYEPSVDEDLPAGRSGHHHNLAHRSIPDDEGIVPLAHQGSRYAPRDRRQEVGYIQDVPGRDPRDHDRCVDPWLAPHELCGI